MGCVAFGSGTFFKKFPKKNPLCKTQKNCGKAVFGVEEVIHKVVEKSCGKLTKRAIFSEKRGKIKLFWAIHSLWKRKLCIKGYPQAASISLQRISNEVIRNVEKENGKTEKTTRKH